MDSTRFQGIKGEIQPATHPSVKATCEIRQPLRKGRPFVRAVAFVALLSVLAASLNAFAPSGISRGSSIASLQDEPVANAGSDLIVYAGDTVVLNGSASTGFEGADQLNYSWAVLYETRTTTYYGMVVEVNFTRTGASVVNLTVRDSLNRTSWDLMTVEIIERPQTFLDKYLMTILILAILGAIAAYVLITVIMRVRSGQPVVSDAGKEKFVLGSRRYMSLTKKVVRNPMGFIGVVILAIFGGLAIVGPAITPYDVHVQDPANSLMLPSKDHWLGTDNYGVDIFSELLYGARTSILVGTVSAVIASFLGAAVGLYSGYVGGWKDEVVMRLNDIVLSIPWLVLMIIVAAFVGKIDLTGIILIIGLTGWSYTARMVRAQVLSVKERQYIERARAIGASEMSIIRRHIFPNTFPLIFANTILTVAVSILSESTLSFLGMRPIDEVTWGTMLSFASEASAFQTGRQWWIIAPGMCIVVVVLGFTLLGYALDEILNPKLRRR